MLHVDEAPGPTGEDDSAAIAARNARYGRLLFLAYLVPYALFVWVNAFRPAWMDTVVLAGINLAVASGFGLIVAAIVSALVYGWLCRSSGGRPAEGDG